MCGIIGRISLESNPKKTIEGLKELEYRGYDSYGILFSNREFELIKKNIGCINDDILGNENLESFIEIGHTRWATHGGVKKENAHPHSSNDEKFHIVMNGIIENFMELKKELIKERISFKSETDTEIVIALFSKYYLNSYSKEKSLLIAMRKTLSILKGEFSFLIKFSNYLIGYKNMNPIIIGKSKNEFFISSDLNLVQRNSEEYTILNDGEIFISKIENETLKISFYNSKFLTKKKKYIQSIFLNEKISKETEYFMEKEIFEQRNMKNILTKKNLESIDYLIKKIKKRSKIFISGAGSSYYSGIFLHYKLLKIGVNSNHILASELKNYSKIIGKDDLILIFSQSGETADLIYPLKKIKADVFTITNTMNSTLERISSKSFFLKCGKEIAVASTKAFTFQLMFSEILLQRFFGKEINLNDFKKFFDELIFNNNSVLDEIANKLKDVEDVFFLGRNENLVVAMESALKLKEISYIHAEGFAGGELKHGSLALIKSGIFSIIFGVDSEILSNAMEIKTRGGIVIGVSSKISELFDYHLVVPKRYEQIFSVILMQILAFKVTILKGLNPDKPRNLAKSVTVK